METWAKALAIVAAICIYVASPTLFFNILIAITIVVYFIEAASKAFDQGMRNIGLFGPSSRR